METQEDLKNTHIDKSIILCFLVTFLVTATVFAFKLANYEPCVVVDFDILEDNHRVGDIVRFKDKTVGGVKKEWDFGDNSKVTSIPNHTFEKPGKYEVTLLVNGKCEARKKITVKEKVFLLDSTRIANFNVPPIIKVGEELSILDETKGATKWEWRFGETSEIDSYEKNPSYTYQSDGIKVITLVVNGDPRYGTKRKILVEPKEEEQVTTPRRRTVRPPVITQPVVQLKDKPDEDPEEEEPVIEAPVKPKAPYISEKDFKEKLTKVSTKNATVDNFSKYLCNDLNIPTQVKNKTMTFRELCKKIRGKTILVQEVKMTRNSEDGCVERLNVKYIRTGLF